MKDINTITRNDVTLISVDNDTMIKDTAQMLDIIATAQYYHPGHAGLVVRKENLPEEFFDLKTKLAGEMLQKFSNYKVKLAIVGDFGSIESKALADFIRECNRGRQIFFVGDTDEAIKKLKDR